MSPKIVDKPKRKREILMAAFELFVQKGYHKTTLGEIARAAGMGQGTLYYYFPAKEQLFWGVYEQLMLDIEAWMNEQISMFKTPGEQLNVVLHLLFETFPEIATCSDELHAEDPAWGGMLIGFSRVFMEFWLQAERSDKREEFYQRVSTHQGAMLMRLQELLEKVGNIDLLGLDAKGIAHLLMAMHDGLSFQLRMGIINKQSPFLAQIRRALFQEFQSKESQTDGC